MFGNKQRVCDAASGGDAGSGGGSAPASAPAPAAPTALATAAQPGQPAAPAPTSAPAGAPAAPSALADAAGVDPLAWAPEKFRVLGTDGKLDIEATAKKATEGYKALEKRLGTGDVAPSAPTDYKLAPPEALADTFKADDPNLQAFLKSAHAAGMSQKQLDVAMGAFFQWAPQIAGASQQLDADQARGELAKRWPDAVDLRQNATAAFRAMSHAVSVEGLDFDRMQEKFGNDPDFIRIASVFGSQMREDTSPGSAPPGGGPDLNELLAHPAYRDAKHPQHQRISQQVAAAFGRR